MLGTFITSMWASNLLFPSVSHHFASSSLPLIISLLSFVSCCMLFGKDVMPWQYLMASSLREVRPPMLFGKYFMLLQSLMASSLREVRPPMLSSKDLMSWQLLMASLLREVRRPMLSGDSQYLKRSEAPNDLCQIIQVPTARDIQMLERDVSHPPRQRCHACNMVQA